MNETTNCCLCAITMPYTGILRSPYSYDKDEYPKRYASVCDECFQKCLDGAITKQQFLDAANPVPTNQPLEWA